MNILVINDDGINSPGLWALAEALSRVGSVLVVAPENQRSGAGTSVTMVRSNITINEAPSKIPGVQTYAIGGTPCDCASWGLGRLSKEHTDLIVSGINLGPNVGYDILYSGTVMATLTGHLLRIPSVAISLAVKNYEEEMWFDAAGRVVESLARCIEKGGMRTEAILNVNVPNIPPEQVKGIMVTRAARLWYLRSRNSSSANSHDAKTEKPEKIRFEEGSDAWALNEGYVSITPVRFEITHHDLIPDVSRCVQDMDCEFGGQ
jgi:5'-nucleotidase